MRYSVALHRLTFLKRSKIGNIGANGSATDPRQHAIAAGAGFAAGAGPAAAVGMGHGASIRER